MPSREDIELLQRRELLKELKRLEEAQEEFLRNGYLRSYKPHPRQDDFHQNKARIRLFLGGNQSGKSRGGYSEDVAFALGERPWDGTKTAQPPARVLIVGPDFKNHHQEITIPYLMKMIPRDALKNVDKDNFGYINRFNFKNASVIKLMSYEQHLKKARNQVSPFEGHMWDFVHFDEPPPYGVYIACLRGIIARAGRMIFTLTPLNVAWLYDQIYLKAGNVTPKGDPEIYAQHVSIHDNPYLNPQMKKMFIDQMPSDLREAREFGKFLHLSGLIYKTFNMNGHILQREATLIEPHWPKGMVIDPHPRKPFACAWFAVNPEGRVIWFDEWPNFTYYEAKDSPVKQIEKYCDIFKEIEARIPGGPGTVIYRLMDPNYGRSPGINIEAKVIDEFAKYGFYFLTEISDDIDEGHIAVSKYLEYNKDENLSFLNMPMMQWTDNCRNFIFGMSHYMWKEHREAEEHALREEADDKFKDFPDLARYLANFGPRYFNVKEHATEIDKEDNKLTSGMRNSGLG